MSDFVFKMNLAPVFGNPNLPKTEEGRFEMLARLVTRRLNAMLPTMEDRGYIFEHGAAESLARRFDEFCEGSDTSCYQFSKLWDDLSDWAEGAVQVGRREKSLCSVPTLPLQFSC